MWKDFKEFAFKGNVLDLAVAVVIGAAFGNIVTSLVENIITPLVGILLGDIDFTSIKLGELLIGNFLQSVFNFLVIAFSIFIFIRLLSRFKRKEDVVAATQDAPPVDSKEVLLEEIRDLLKNKQTIDIHKFLFQVKRISGSKSSQKNTP
ncbi:large conductance mechanosensitive channel protein MscL [Psychrobacillus sp. NPDC093200]|uniref:large conductance mechanosensitive channel protein MscL n=1 Tax=Psychrobacillus sp. NPDC093200 TaxID=3390656 RepID=UPI003CFF5D64